MKKFNKILSLTSAFLLTITFSFAQRISLQEAEEFAVKNNLQLRTAQAEIKHQEALVPTAILVPKTSFELQYGSIQMPNTGDYSFTIAQPFYNPKENKARKALFESYVKQATTEQELLALDIKQKVRQSYYTFAFYGQLLDLLSNQDTLFTKAIRRAEVRYGAGETSLLEKTNLEIQKQELLNRVTMAKYRLEREELVLKQLLQWTSPTILVDQAELEKETLIPNLDGNSPFVQRIDRLNDINQGQVTLAQSSLKPDFFAGITNQSMSGSFSQFVAIGGINIPIFQKAGKAKVEAYKIQQNVLSSQKSALESEILNAFETLNNELSMTLKEKEYLHNIALPQAELVSNTAQKQYLLGEINYLEYQQNFKQAYDIREQYLNKLLEQKRIENNIMYLLGR